ncbi:Outer membrane protein assembly factor BamD [Pirellulimonas nuda]|uniref:Outer membrane protein assembly factor BamD n=1 Tax=Pirellulimonas nuda TaxID=2528009 RepID=A0A518D9T0_9BACT|nr:tetratricopeptide repeat protein [Pirellulimonas nuda]QDU88241.1 Outer membrane protein assembly factor BamD [Pirellulimonas nuda]
MKEPDALPTPSRPGLLSRARAWAGASRMRQLAIAATLGAVVLGTIVAWLATARLALQRQALTLPRALRALDEGEWETAGLIADQLHGSLEPTDGPPGGVLYVLGASQAARAKAEWSPERRKNGYASAARYLQQAQILGLPEEREADAAFLLGFSLVESDQLEQGKEALEEAIELGCTEPQLANRLIAESYFFSSPPRYAEAIERLDRILSEEGADPNDPERVEAKLRKAEALNALSRYSEALTELTDEVPPDLAARRAVARAAAQIGAARAAEGPQRAELLELAVEEIKRAESLDKLATGPTRAARLLAGRVAELRGRPDEAQQSYEVLRRSFGACAESVAAAIAEGDMALAAGNQALATESYRRSLLLLADVPTIRSELAPKHELRKSLIDAGAKLVRAGRFEDAISLLGDMGSLLEPGEQAELRADTLAAWGEALLAAPDEPTQHEGYRRLREAGQNYERLAEIRYATAEYPEYLWRSSEAYLSGHSFTSAARILRRYLNEETKRRGAQALLRMGQAQLGLGSTDAAIAALEECIEFYPNDAASYQARLDCARAYQARGKSERAEALLRDNLVGGTLAPRSAEWRDSLLELGRLLHEQGRHAEASDKLEEYVLRYPGSQEAQLARYLTAESYRHSAAAPMAAAVDAPALAEREKARELAHARLSEALRLYSAVQKEITLGGAIDDLSRAMLRNCYMMQGSVLFDLERYKDAIDMYSNVSTLYQDQPFVLETLVEISLCWRRLRDPIKARLTVKQAQELLERLPPETDFASSTNLKQDEWRMLLDEMGRW